ncbi:MAG: sialate O-acetylesterase [Mariniblastus sp.]|jgi:sialate O-acetylesterase
MFRFRFPLRSILMVGLLLPGLLNAQDRSSEKMPKENVVDVPAMVDGLCVSNVFQSNMVLQRDKPVSIWGWATAGEEVTVSINGNKQGTTAGQDRSWKVILPSMVASSEPENLIVTGANQTLKLENILIGDVWVLGGQSNMEFPLDRIENGQLEIVSANYPNIRILTVPAMNGPKHKVGFERLHEWSGWFGRHYRKGDWDECTPEMARELSAIGYVFARRVHMASKVPIGVIDASRGGTTVETWTPDSVLRGMDSALVKPVLAEWDAKVAGWDAQAELARRVKNYRQKVAKFEKEGREMPANETEPTTLLPGPAMDQNRPGNCFASMIGPLKGLQVKGAIFHQGYNNCFNGTQGTVFYGQVFPKMIEAWRSAFDDPDMPFGILSLCTEGTSQTLDNYCELMANPGPYIREAQYKTFLDLYLAGDKNIGFTSTYDLRRRWYHPQLKIPAGERIARWALATQYGLGQAIRWKPPMVEAMRVVDGRIELQLDEPASAIDNGGPILGFAVAGEDRKFQPAKAEHLVTGNDDRNRPKLNKKVLVLSSPLVPQPIHYRYAWGRSPLGNLQAERMTDIPFATQRSDDWSLENVPLGVHAEEVTGKLDRQQQRKLIEALRAQDVERILAEAELLKAAKGN